MRSLTWQKAWVWLILAFTVFIYFVPVSPARAGCETSGSTETCTGDTGGPVVNDTNGIHTVIIRDLTNDISGDTPIRLLHTGATNFGHGVAGGDAPSLEIDFDGGNFGLFPAPSNDGIVAFSTGGGGGPGSSVSASAGSGGAGGTAGDVVVNFTSGGLTTDNAPIQAVSTGGKGGKGGDGSSSGPDTGKGGKGGAGGTTGDVVITVATGNFGLSNIFKGFRAQSFGGDGGAGGSGTNTGDLFPGAAHGGVGGAGGNAGSASITFGDTDSGASVSFNMTASNTFESSLSNGIVANSIGGNGGNAGKADTSTAAFTNADGFSGGAGGSTAGASVVIESGSNLGITASGTGVLIQSTGGNGGNGSEADSVGESSGGNGGAGGVAGDAELTITDSSLLIEATGSSNSHGIQISVLGGNGGDGGSADTTFANTAAGGNAGNGGNSGIAELTVDSTSNLGVGTGGTSSHAIVVESLAGNGGKGGNASGAIGDSDGGDGGAGGTGGDVTVIINNAALGTAGDQSQGLFARSYGGAGGDGGSKTGGTGGSGGASKAPGPGGNVSVTFTGGIFTDGDDSNAILAQSVGGFAGDAGSASGAFIAYGASGESGGNAGFVTVIIGDGSNFTTLGDVASGVDAHSTGGGGGKGGSASAVVGLGGVGSAGGHGGTVTVNAGAITINTAGQQSRGLSAASHGGGGGNAGSSHGVVSIGGGGGTGGDGGLVSVTSSATITTTGDYADGIFSQSIGGGGGSAHSTSGLVAIGGSGGGGGNGLDVSVTINGGSISTAGKNADGIFLQSVGGGGGDGSHAVGIGVEFSYAVGGSGGSGGTGGDVTFSDNVTDPYSISTTGDFSHGLFAQSIGGGGGDGGYAVAASAGLILDFSMGASGSGGTGNHGGHVSVDTNVNISTAGSNSTALFAHSVGGGGGSAGTAVVSANDLKGISISLAIGGKGGHAGDGGSVTVATQGAITTAKDNSIGIFAQSVGGGGGNSGLTIAGSVVSTAGSIGIAVGGKGGSGGNGGVVKITQGGAVNTGGNNAPAIFGQSLGGGGGNSGATISGSVFSLASLNLAIGADGGSAGDGNAVTVVSSADATTTGGNSPAIIAQSVGGSGGVSGFTASGSIVDYGDLGITIGGNGGDGGIGGTVMLSTAANTTISTTGNNSSGLLAQSLGGTGGVAGISLTASGVSVGTIGITVEGNGGAGGSSGDVTVENAATINTTGTFSNAIQAQSLAGGGGSATAAITATGISTGSFSSAIGGDGGSGGIGGIVTVDNTGALTTGGPYASGIFAQSLGGDGGNGGLAVDAGITLGAFVSGNMSVTVGGNGGGGGTAGAVIVTNEGAISTSDFGSPGISAQSIGGDGGTGGSAIAGTFTFSEDISVDISFSLGGSGGDSGIGGEVFVTNNPGGDISTTGALSHGIMAQSIGGNGGNGGSAYTAIIDIGGAKANVNIGVTVGGSGGDGAVGGNVGVENKAKITTEGVSSSGIYAQSIGGNGGNGGNAVNIIALFQGKAGQVFSGRLEVAVGGSGGTGSDAGTVMVDNSGNITTKGSTAHAIFAHSVGGGGGDGGDTGNYSLGARFPSGPAGDSANKGFTRFKVSVKIGGSGGAAGDGEEVTVTNSGDLETEGSAAYGIFAQSVGGGGGNGGNGSVSFAGATTNSTANVLIPILGDITNVYAAYRDLSNFYSSWSIEVGGSGGAAGNGGDVMVQNDGNISTTGGSGTAIFAQSVGGGGGNGGDEVGGLITTAIVGGSGSGGGKGGTVTIDNTGTLSTTGFGAMGIFAQSIGGSGGSAGDIEMTFLNSFTDLNIGAGIIVQEDPGDGGDGGDVTISSSGSINTTGKLALGIFAQSAGGSGGASGINGFAGAIGLAGSGQAAGNGGEVNITTTAPITVTGAFSVGIFAQSTGGNVSGSTADNVTISVGGDITASGKGGRGILAQSEGHDSNGTIDITIAQGVTVSTGEEGFETIGIKDGKNNKITNNGTIEKAEGNKVNGYAVIADGGLLTIDNFGTFAGSVSLDSDFANVFNNQSGATLNLGLEFDLGGDSAALTNDGTMSPGGSGVISTSTITGTLTQSTTGTYVVDLSMGTSPADGSGDQLVLQTTGASFAGTIAPNLVDDNMLASGESGQVLIAFTNVSGGTITATATVADTATVDFSLLTGTNSFGGQSLALKYTVDLSGLSNPMTNNPSPMVPIPATHSPFANYLVELVDYARTSQPEGSAELTFITDLLNSILTIETLGELIQTYASLTTEELNLTSFGTTLATLDFHRAMQSCAAYGENGLANFNRQGRCVWGRVQGSTLKQSANSSGRVPHKQDGFSFATGVQVARSDTLFFGLGLAYDWRDLSNPTFNSETSTFQLGIVMKKVVDDWTISGTVSVGIFDAKTIRSVTTPMGTFFANADPDGGFFSFQARVDKVFHGDGWYVKPIAALTLVQFWQDSFSETTAGDFGVSVQSVSDVSVIAQPALEFGGELFGPSSRAFVRVGAFVYVAGRSTPISVRFSNLGVSSPLVSLNDMPDRTHGELAVGFDFDLGGGKSLSMLAEGTLSKNSRSYGGSAKFRFKF